MLGPFIITPPPQHPIPYCFLLSWRSGWYLDSDSQTSPRDFNFLPQRMTFYLKIIAIL